MTKFVTLAGVAGVAGKRDIGGLKVPVLGSFATPTTSLGRAPSRPGLAFLPTATQGRLSESPQTGFLRPTIRAVVPGDGVALSVVGTLGAVGPLLGRLLGRLLVPRTGVGRAVQTIGVNWALDELLALADPLPFSFLNVTKARQFAVKAAIRFYRAYATVTSDNNVSVVFVPENEPGLDLLKWDP